MAERRAVVLRDPGALRKEARAELDRYIERPAPDTVLLVVSPAGAKPDRVLQTAAGAAGAFEFAPLREDRLPRWITHHAATALGARVTVRDLKLKNIPTSLIGGGLTGLVQDAIDDRVNPVEILRAEQLGARVPVTRTDELRLRAADVLHEVVGRELRLRIVFELVQSN